MKKLPLRIAASGDDITSLVSLVYKVAPKAKMDATLMRSIIARLLERALKNKQDWEGALPIFLEHFESYVDVQRWNEDSQKWESEQA